jgi:hypothetical protein
MSMLLKIHPAGAELFPCGRADTHGEVNSCFSQFCKGLRANSDQQQTTHGLTHARASTHTQKPRSSS